ncbi:MAG: IPExxxVDY family protein [Prevotellaceae bacterium]|jgi:hypothetical protein|nr:IPExxxVDY family protein [Prevotellaceae bacterium]
MKSKTLKLEENNYNFVVLAIVSTEDDYYLIWNLNNILSLNLNRTEHPMLKNLIPAGETISYFNYICDKIGIEYSFIRNKYSKFRLIRQLASIDFMLKISGNLTNDQINHIIAAIRSVKGITACINLNVKKTPLFSVFERI